ncbi:maker141, partial [Drosophila busckii]
KAFRAIENYLEHAGSGVRDVAVIALTIQGASANGGGVIATGAEDKLKLLTTTATAPMPTVIKTEPMPDLIALTANNNSNNSSNSNAGSVAASTSAAAAAAALASNGPLVLVPNKRARLEARPGAEDWISAPSPGSAPSSAAPLSPSPGSYNMSNGYASPMSAGSYDPTVMGLAWVGQVSQMGTPTVWGLWQIILCQFLLLGPETGQAPRKRDVRAGQS